MREKGKARAPLGPATCARLPSFREQQNEVKALDLIIEAKDPHGRGSVMVLCRSRGEAIETIAKLGREGYRDISVSDADGSIIPKEQLTDSH